MSLVFKMLSRLVIDFLTRRKSLLISWLQSPYTVLLEPPKNTVSLFFHCFLIYLPWSDPSHPSPTDVEGLCYSPPASKDSEESKWGLHMCFEPQSRKPRYHDYHEDTSLHAAGSQTPCKEGAPPLSSLGRCGASCESAFDLGHLLNLEE